MTAAAESTNNTPISRKQAYWTFGVVALALLMSSIDSTIVAVALPTLITDLKTNLALTGWTITGYQFSQCIIMPIAGKLSDEWGRKRLFLFSIVLFTISSIAAGFAPNVYFLVVFRVIQGIGGGAFLPSATGIVSDAFGSRRAQAIGLFGSIFPIGGIIGPNLGGLLLDNWSWRWIFFVNVPVGVLLLSLGLLILPRGQQAINSSNRKIDVTGIGLFSGAIFSILYGITNWANNPGGGIEEALTFGLFALGIALFVLFFRHEDRVSYPIIETKLLRWRPFLAVNIYNFIFGAVIFGLVSYIPYYATIAYGMTPGQDGLLLTPRSLTMIVFSAVTSIFVIRFRYRLPMIVGQLVMASSVFILSQGWHEVVIFGLDFLNLVFLAAVVGIVGIGMGVANPAANNAAIDLIPEKVAAVTGMRGMSRLMGGVLATATISLILTYAPNKAQGMQDIYLGFGFMLLALIPIVFLIPDSAHERANHSAEAHAGE